MSVFLSTEHVVTIHDLQSSQPMRNYGTLAGAVARPRATWGNKPLFSHVPLQAAVLLISVCQAQAFVDGNKRAAWVACDVFLALNALQLPSASDDDILELMQSISTRAITENAVSDWIDGHTERASHR